MKWKPLTHSPSFSLSLGRTISNSADILCHNWIFNFSPTPLRLVRPQSSGLLLMRPTNEKERKGEAEKGGWRPGYRNSLYICGVVIEEGGSSALRLKEECTELLVIAAWNKVPRHNNLIWVIYRALATSKDKGRRNSAICCTSFPPPSSLYFFLSFFFFSSPPLHRSQVFFAKARRGMNLRPVCVNYKDVTGVICWGRMIWRGIRGSLEDC